MRILDISFSNLNSLVGSWHIDLTHPEFTREGIFAITGPTGAGKTTILDAICLALYGATPRLGKVGGKSGNDLMSRHCGECQASVTFETSGGRYVSHWAQHRARRRASGDLQSARHEVSDAQSGKILASTLKESATLIVDLTGMGFEQFSRSMMLAQGAFAAFLQARSEERAPILEQITGSEIYSQISMVVHERRGQEKSRLDALREQIQGTQVLTVQARQALDEQIAELERQVRLLYGASQSLGQRLQVLQRLQEIEANLQVNEQNRQMLEKRLAEFEPELERLQAARRARHIAPHYQSLVQARSEQRAEQDSLLASQALMPTFEARVNEARLAVQSCEAVWQVQRDQFDAIEPVLEKVRSLDASLGQAGAQIVNLGQTCTQTQKDLQALDEQQKDLRNRLDAARSMLSELEKERSRRSIDAELVEEMSGLRKTFQALAGLDQQIDQLGQKVRGDEAVVTSAEQVLRQVGVACDEVTLSHQQLVERVAQMRAHFDALLQQRALTEWQSQYSDLLERKAVCETAIERDQVLKGLATQIDKDERALAEASARGHQLDLTVGQLQAQVQMRQQQLEGLQQQLILHRRIEDYAQARLHLHEGEPCPLCGALEHPYAEGVATESDNVLRELKSCQSELERVSKMLAAQQLERSQISQLENQTMHQLKVATDRVTDLQAELPKLFAKLGVTHRPVAQSVTGFLAELRDLILQDITSVRQRIDEAVEVARSLQTLEVRERESGQVAERARAEVLKARQQSENSKYQVGQSQILLEQALKNRQMQADSLVEQLARYGVDCAALDRIDVLVDQLEIRRQTWLRLCDDHQDVKQMLPALEQSLQSTQDSIQKRRLELQSTSQRLQVLQTESDRLRDERRSLLQDRDPVKVQRDLRSAIDQARQRADQARADLAQEDAARQQHASRIESTLERIQARALRITEMEQDLTTLLGEYGFMSEADLRAAALAHERLQALEAQEQSLLQEESAIQTTRQTLLTDRHRLAPQVQQDDTIDGLTLQMKALDSQYREQSESLGGLRQRVQNDELAKAEHVIHLERIDAQARELERWSNLHELIGSADGKKFRTFAQGLTFEVVIQHANQQLQRMTDRYLLIRGVQEPLELNVVDQYQAAEIRTTKNLSGGESFLVSLALALGLSKMASRNVRVDSLFLDEGFGTLDEDALEMALQTLSSLHQEGKLIGVISHVQALKDRIATQIQVAPVRGGRSEIQGPGCSRIQTEQ